MISERRAHYILIAMTALLIVLVAVLIHRMSQYPEYGEIYRNATMVALKWTIIIIVVAYFAWLINERAEEVLSPDKV